MAKAKQVIDMMIAVESLTEGVEFIPVLGSLDYENCFPDIVQERMFFVRERASEVRTYQLILTESGSSEVQKIITQVW